jgi:hypothetical protein
VITHCYLSVAPMDEELKFPWFQADPVKSGPPCLTGEGGSNEHW